MRDYEGIEFPVGVKDYSKLEWINTIKINVFGYKIKQFKKISVRLQVCVVAFIHEKEN